MISTSSNSQNNNMISNHMIFIPSKVIHASILVQEKAAQKIQVRNTIVSKKLEMEGDFVQRAFVRLLLEIPVHLNTEDISVRIRGSKLPLAVTSQHTTVEINYCTRDPHFNISSLPHTPTQIGVDVPLIQCGFEDRRALLDHVHLLGEHCLHHTVRVRGNSSQFNDSRVRIAMYQLEQRFEVTSVSNSSFDSIRFKDSCSRAADYTRDKVETISRGIKRKWNERKNGKSDTTTTTTTPANTPMVYYVQNPNTYNNNQLPNVIPVGN